MTAVCCKRCDELFSRYSACIAAGVRDAALRVLIAYDAHREKQHGWGVAE